MRLIGNQQFGGGHEVHEEDEALEGRKGRKKIRYFNLSVGF
jgi:hypothetical protein